MLFISLLIMVNIDDKYNDNNTKIIEKNTSLNNIKYVNVYDNNYIVLDDENLYLFNSEYEEITRLDLSLIHNNKNNYDIVYKDKNIMYMKDYKKQRKIIFEYYDIYTYELIDTVVLGG